LLNGRSTGVSFDLGGKVTMLLFAVAVAGYFTYQAGRVYRVYPRKKFLAWAVLRSVTLLCLLLAAAGCRMYLAGSGVTTLFLVDRSLSMGEQAGEIEAWLNRQVEEYKGGRDRIGVVSFAKEPMVETPVTGETGEIKFQTAPDPNFTNIQSALEFCRDYFPKDAQKRLVLITDGRENAGDAESALRSLGEWGINLVVYPVLAAAGKDVQLTAVRAPSNARWGEKIPIEVKLSSNYETEGTFSLFNGGVKVLEEEAGVGRGENTFRCEVTLNRDCGADFRGEISFAGDQNPLNDFFTVTAPVRGGPNILVVGESEETANIERLLAGLGVSHRRCRPGEAPGEPGDLSVYDEIIMVNVPCRDLPAGFEAALEKCVGEQGVGLVVVGGDRSFAPGGYEDTTIEKMLPVKCRMKGNEKLPDTGLVLAVDCSGSMNDESGGVRKLEMVKEAAVKSMEALEEEDCLGVLAFSDVQEWTAPFGPLAQKEEVANNIGRLEPRGGTLILPALEEAAGVLEKADVKVKHIILLTDGQAEKEGYDGIVNRLRAGGITLSTVAVGLDADRNLLETLGDKGGGRSYYTEYFRDVPEIFTKETYLATKKYLNSREFVPRQAGGSEFPGGGALPALYGYTGSGAREEADIVLESDSGDPVLAFRHYGLGLVAAWTSDLSGKWSGEWIKWDRFQEYCGMVLNKCLSTNNKEEGLDLSISQRGCSLSASAGVPGFENGQSFEMKVFSPGGRERAVALDQTGPGVFEGGLELAETGSYALDFKLKMDGVVLRQAKRTVHLDYSPEYAADPQEEKVFLPGAFGQVVDGSADIFALPLDRKNTAAAPLDHILLALALAAYIGEIWVRKML
jgi:Mg-chelatase subunit ChlD